VPLVVREMMDAARAFYKSLELRRYGCTFFITFDGDRALAADKEQR
jgi:hypothetical protein